MKKLYFAASLVVLSSSLALGFGFGGGGGGGGRETGPTKDVTAKSLSVIGQDGKNGFVIDRNSIAFSNCTTGKNCLYFNESDNLVVRKNGDDEESIGGASSLLQLSDWPAGVSATEVGYLGGVTSGIQAQIDAISVGAPVVSVPTYSDESCAAGTYAFDTTYAYFCRATNTWDRIAFAGWSNPAPVAPTITAAAIGTDGTTLTLTASANTSIGAGGSGGLDVDCTATGNDNVATYVSGAGSTTLVYSLATTVQSTATDTTCNLDYTNPGNGLEGTTGGVDVGAFADAGVTNGSTQVASLSRSDNFNRANGELGSNWTTWTGRNAFTITSNQVAGTSGGTATSAMYWSADTFAGAQCSEVQVVVDGSSSFVSPAVLMSTTEMSGYQANVTGGAPPLTSITVRKFVASTGSDLGTAITGLSINLNDYIKLCSSGANPQVLSVYQNGVLLGTRTDSSSPHSAGQPGAVVYGTSNRFDNWAGTTP